MNLKVIFGLAIQTAVSQPVLHAIFKDFCTKVFENAKISRWHHCNADNFKIQ